MILVMADDKGGNCRSQLGEWNVNGGVAALCWYGTGILRSRDRARQPIPVSSYVLVHTANLRVVPTWIAMVYQVSTCRD